MSAPQPMWNRRWALGHRRVSAIADPHWRADMSALYTPVRVWPRTTRHVFFGGAQLVRDDLQLSHFMGYGQGSGLRI